MFEGDRKVDRLVLWDFLDFLFRVLILVFFFFNIEMVGR